MRSDAFNKLIPIDIPKEQEGQYKEILIANAVRFFCAGGVLTLDAWCNLTPESQDAFIEARTRIISSMEETEEKPEETPEEEPKQEDTK